jgi:hypothetical protein
MKSNALTLPARRTCLIAALFLNLSTYCAVGMAMEKEGRATVPIRGGVFSSVTDKERLDARKAALFDAWKNYINNPSTSSQARINTVERNRADIDARIERCVSNPSDCDFFSSVQYISENLNKDNKTLTVYLIANVNDQKVNAYLGNVSPAGKQQSGSGSGFAFLFLQRNVTTNTQYDGSDGNKAVRDTAKFGGDLAGGSDVAAKLNEGLVQAGFESMSFEDIAGTCNGMTIHDEALASYKQGGTVSNFAEMARFTKACGLADPNSPINFKYFAVAEAEVSAPLRDRGLQTVVFNIRVRVTNISRGIPQTIASAGPIQFTGRGPDSIAATRDGLQLSGAAAARLIIDIMNDKGLR